LPVTFLGQQPREEVFRMLATAHLLLLTSQFEVFPFSVLEAYSQGVPVISSRFAGAEDFIDAGRTGLLVNADYPDQVARSVARLLTDATWLAEMGRAAQSEFRRRFGDPDVMAQAYAKIYSDVAGRCGDE
jgi:glycosyltransferase involved in cell wall biosynthesis